MRALKKIVKKTSLYKKIMGVESPKIPNIIDYKKYPQVYMASFGSKNPDKTFYVIGGHKAGFFSNLQFVIAHIRIAESFNMIPIVDFKNFPNIYNEKELINNTNNSWEYYFHQVSDYSLDEVYQSKNVYFCCGYYTWDFGHYLSNHNFFDYYKKYIKLNTEIENEISNFYNKEFVNKKILGIHFRGNEQNRAPGHPYCPTLKQMISATENLIREYSIDKLYLVTEEKSFFDAFVERYKDKLLFTDYYRTKDTNGYLIKPPRENHIYLLGKEIAIATFLLSKCNGLLHASSNVSQAAIFFNNNTYQFRVEIDNGVNSNNKFIARFSYFFKKLLPSKIGGLKNLIKVYRKDEVIH